MVNETRLPAMQRYRELQAKVRKLVEDVVTAEFTRLTLDSLLTELDEAWWALDWGQREQVNLERLAPATGAAKGPSMEGAVSTWRCPKCGYTPKDGSA